MPSIITRGSAAATSFGFSGIFPFILNLLSGVLPSTVSVSSPSLGGLITDSNGYLTYKPNNLLTYSNTFGNAPWAGFSGVTLTTGQPDPLGGTNATKITVTSAGFGVYQSIGSSIGAFLISVKVASSSTGWVTLFMSDGGSNYAGVWFNTSTGAVGLTQSGGTGYAASSPQIVPDSNGFYFVSFVLTKTSTSVGNVNLMPASANGSFSAVGNDAIFYAATDSAVTYEIAPRPGDLVITGASAYYGPAFDYSATSVGTPIGLRVWESRTNWIQSSGSPGNSSWTLGGAASITTSSFTAPDGISKFIQLSQNSTYGEVYQSYPGTAGTASFYVKQGAASACYIASGGSDGTVYNFTTGFSYQGSWSNGTVTNIGNGILRISAYNSNPSATKIAFGTNGQSIYLWGCQYEQNANFVGPYIPTGTSAVAAAADVVTTNNPLTAYLTTKTAVLKYLDHTNTLQTQTSPPNTFTIPSDVWLQNLKVG